MAKPLRKAVFPVAGLGTRFLPASKAMPKEMLTIVDKPVIQYAVDEARAAGIEHFIFVTGRNKTVIEDHFDIQVELEETLMSRNKTKALSVLRADLPAPGAVSFTRQQKPLGLGHAVWCARHLVGDEPFALLLPDMVTKAVNPCLAAMRQVYEHTGGNVISVARCKREETHRYGIVGLQDEPSAGVKHAYAISHMVEKPAPEEAPSTLYINGRYILQPEIFDQLARQSQGAGGEIQLTDAMLRLMETHPFYAMEFQGETFDCGSKIGFLTANAAFALERAELGEEFAAVLKNMLNSI